MYQKKHSGFTLIELLVVIAIIGALSAVVLASLNTARFKGSDAASKQGLSGTRSQAELFFVGNGSSYVGVCSAPPAPNGTKSIYTQVLSAAQAQGLGSFSVNAIGAPNQTTCNTIATGWAAEVPLKAGGMYCVDYLGNATTTGAFTLTAIGDVTCG